MQKLLLPQQLASLAQAWDFQPHTELPAGHCSRAFADDTRVLKLPLRGEELTSGYHASFTLQDIGGPKILAQDPNTKAILMERLLPGTKLSEDPKVNDLEIYIPLAQKCKTLNPVHFIPLADYFEDHSPLQTYLTESSPPSVPLHGDLHHENILLHNNTYRPIDPKGILGDPAYECTAFLRNPFSLFKDLKVATDTSIHRIEVLSQALNLDPYRIAAWFLADRDDDGDIPLDHPWRLTTKVATAAEQHFRPKNVPNLQKPLY